MVGADWLRRIGRAPPPTAPVPEDVVPGRVERSTPGVAALLDGIEDDRSHAVLDLGTATDSSLALYSRFARRIRFADLLASAGSAGEWSAALDALPAQPDHPYDLVLAWDVLDRIDPEERPALVSRLAEVTSDSARLHIMVDASDSKTTRPLRFALLGRDRIRYEPVGPEVPARPPVLPAEVERLLAPFEVRRAFTLRVGLREYVASRSPPGRVWA